MQERRDKREERRAKRDEKREAKREERREKTGRGRGAKKTIQCNDIERERRRDIMMDQLICRYA